MNKKQFIKIVESDCPQCHSSDKIILITHLRDVEDGTPGRYNINVCNNCELIYLSPRPSKSSLKECYPDTYYTSKKSDKFNLSKKLFERRYLNRLNRFSKATNKQPKSLFEVGYGDGSFLTFLKSKWENNCDLSGIDFKLPKMSHHLDGINLFEGDFSTIKLNQTFDVIVMYQVLEHLQDPLTICKELHSMLKEDGILVIEVPNWDSLWRNH